VHGIEVIPFAAPNKTVLFEDSDDLRGHAVAIDDGALVRPPIPIIRNRGIEIDGDTVAVRARLAGVGHGAAIVGAGDRVGGAFDVFRQSVDLRRHRAQLRVDAVDRRDADRFAPGFWQPSQRHKAGRHLALLAIAVHLGEERGIAEAARIGIDGRRLCQRAARIGDAKLVGDGRVPSQFLEGFTLGAVRHRHDGSVTPAQNFIVMAGERARVSGDQVVERGKKLVALREKRSPACQQREPDDEANPRHHLGALAPLDR
jgi:hypothetical protein